MMSVFQLRKEVAAASGTSSDSSNDAGSLSQNMDDRSFVSVAAGEPEASSVVVLTENEKYSVRKLNADPLQLVESANNSGSVDTFSQKAIVNDSSNLFIWKYNSSQKSVPFNKIPLNGSGADAPVCLLTWPATMDDSNNALSHPNSNENDYGICIVYKNEGKIVFYEDISSINNLYSQLSQNMAHTLDLGFQNTGEYITMTLGVEPSGIILATSFGRVLFVTIRDSMGKSSLQLKQQLIKSQKNIFSNLFTSTTSTASKKRLISNHVVSLKNGPIIGKGERLLYITTKNGDFHIWQLSVASNCYKRISTNINNQILDSLKDLYPFAYGSLRIWDSHPLFHGDSNTHIFLSSISDGKDSYYILSTLIFDERANNFSIFSTYRLNTYSLPMESTNNMNKSMNYPKLFIPNSLVENKDPILNVVVLFPNALVITQISSKLDLSFTLKRKWEDIISFRSDINIIGTGYNSNQILLISKEIGGIIEIDLNKSNHNENENENIAAASEPRFVKSHVDQAIYFANTNINNPVEFNLSNDIFLDKETIEHDLKLSSDEIFFSTGKYISPHSTNLEQHLITRINYFKHLFSFIKTNFNNKISPSMKLYLIENFEIMNSCLKFYQYIENIKDSSKKIHDIWSNILTRNNLTIDSLMIGKIDMYPQVLRQFLSEITQITSSETTDLKTKIVELLISCIYDAVLEDGEKTLRYDKLNLDVIELNENKLPWFINLENLENINKIFFDYKFGIKENDTITVEMKEEFLTLLKILYYCFNEVRLWISQNPSITESSDYETLVLINKLYLENHIDWNRVLCELNYKTQSIQITEFYKDIESLVQTLETLPKNDETFQIYNLFFEKFSYAFASTLFEYYADENKLKELFYRFPEQHDQLVRFFREKPTKYGSISWIQDIIDSDYSAATKTLTEVELLGKSIEKSQFYLNVAKLSALAAGEDGNDVDIDQLQRIQCNLDLLDGETDILYKLKEQQIEINTKYVGTDMEVLFVKISELLKDHKTVSFNEIIEFYSVLGDEESIYCATKLLAFNSNNLEYEIKKYLVVTLWRRCILLDGQKEQHDQTVLYSILKRFFEEHLYLQDYPLPSIDMLTDKSIVTDELLQNLYSKYIADGNVQGIRTVIEGEINDVSENITQSYLQSIISSSNDATGNQCVINYETNEIEKN